MPFFPIFFALLLASSDAYKIVVFVPSMVKSQVVFNTRVAETLAKAGHDMTLVMIDPLGGAKSSTVMIPEQVKTYYLNTSTGLSAETFDESVEKLIFKDLTLWDIKHFLDFAIRIFIGSCRKMVENKEFIKWLEAEKFDLAFSYVADICPVGVIHHAKVPTWIWLNSAPLIDFVAYYMGVPIIPSYVPPLAMASSDHMNFIERTKSLIGYGMEIILWKWFIADKQTVIFREVLDPHFPDLVELGKKCPLVMVNSNELYDYPRPTLAKIVNIGGVGYQMKDAKPLEPEFSRVVDTASDVILFSFGSVVPSDRMPMAWKMAFIEAFKRFPNYQFIWRYVGSDIKDKLPSNVHIYKWLPQSDLLQHKKTRAFITHGGYNSLQEAISAGVPLVAVPMGGDQPRNAELAERHGFAVRLEKSHIKADAIAEALNKILSDQSYSRNVKRLSQMVKKKPVSVAHLLVSWTEFVAEFKTLDNLVPAGVKLNFFQYHSLDVIALLLFVAVIILFVALQIVKYVVRKLLSAFSRAEKPKTD
ncbi:UDP-glucoronosyl and UDP-glucosyl transferase [Oesophagostomum dentatum]|uniref:UDP-glucuronosyltransferase n=1 Tax=Oesophagostomum dentatum TaxID=61180 RepID=A0A0B1TLL7_OESDE|nr:UDP-glucoronosyl and UDP-glucosyl transferase [Oesophagostomum dentatum]